MYRSFVDHFSRPVHRLLRADKVRAFFEIMSPQSCDTLLDVGGTVGVSNEFAHLHHFFSQTTVLNLRADALRKVHDVEVLCADARAIPLPDKSVDWIFSNAVIEHVGDESDQASMATEIMRVARKGFFVLTPNRWFPIEPHTYRLITHYFVRDFMTGNQNPYRCRLLSAGDLNYLFPRSHIKHLNLGTSVAAYQRLS